MKKYMAILVLDNKSQKIEFETDIKPVEFLWTRYGMSTYIERVEEIEEEV